MDTTGAIIAILVAALGGGTIGAIINGLFQRRKVEAEAVITEADANDKIRVTVMSLIEPLTARVKELECEVRELKAENAGLRDWAEALIRQIKGLGGTPIPYQEPKSRPGPRSNE